MATIAQLTDPDLLALERRMQLAVHGATSLAAAAQTYVQTVYAALSDSLVLLRVFATVPFGRLPAVNQAFVRQLAATVPSGDAARLGDETLVLSLLGSAGSEPDWCDPSRSRGHIGIPLLSVEFIDAIPMIARLLKQLGVELDWLGREDMAVVGKTFGFQSGVFHVPTAATAVDARGRKIISAQDFVSRYAIETVFGLGGGYVGTPVFVTIIGFCRDHLDAGRVEALRPHIDRFKAETVGLVADGRVF